MSNFKFVKCTDGKNEVVTNLPCNYVNEALKGGFKVVDPSTWEPFTCSKEEIADLFFNGCIDLIREIK